MQQVKLLELPGETIGIAGFLGKAVEPPLQQSVTSAIQVWRWVLVAAGWGWWQGALSQLSGPARHAGGIWCLPQLLAGSGAPSAAHCLCLAP